MLTSAFAIPTDDALVSRARAGDLEALESVFRAFETPVYNLARRMLRNAEDAEDVLQETFMEVMRSIHRFRGEGPLAGWIRRVAASKALMKIRSGKHTRGDASLEEAFDPEATGIPDVVPFPTRVAGEKVDLESALSRLPRLSRAVVWLHDVEGYTHEEIAEMTGKTPSFSKSQLARAHARLRGWLGQTGEGTPCT